MDLAVDTRIISTAGIISTARIISTATKRYSSARSLVSSKEGLKAETCPCIFAFPYLIADERHPAVVGPREADDWRVPVVDELDGPAALVLDPHEDDPRGVARGKLLVRLVPSHQGHLSEIPYRDY